MTCRFSESVFVLCNCWIRQDWGIYFEYLIVCSGYRHILWVSNMTNTKKRIESKQNIGTYRNTTCVDKNTIFASCFFSHCIIYFFTCVSFFWHTFCIFLHMFSSFSQGLSHISAFADLLAPCRNSFPSVFFSLNSIYSILIFAWFPIRAWVWQIPGLSGGRHQQVQTGWDFLCTPLWSGWELLGVVFWIGPRIRCLPQGSTVCHARFERQSTGTGEARTRRGPRSPRRPLHQLSNLNRRANVGDSARTWTDGGPLWNPTGLGCLCDRLDRVWPREDTDFVRALRKGHKFARFSWFKFKWNLKVLDFSVARFFCWMRFGGKIGKSLRNCDGPDEDHSAE